MEVKLRIKSCNPLNHAMKHVPSKESQYIMVENERNISRMIEQHRTHPLTDHLPVFRFAFHVEIVLKASVVD
jgi:hypothetical protein